MQGHRHQNNVFWQIKTPKIFDQKFYKNFLDIPNPFIFNFGNRSLNGSAVSASDNQSVEPIFAATSRVHSAFNSLPLANRANRFFDKFNLCKSTLAEILSKLTATNTLFGKNKIKEKKHRSGLGNHFDSEIIIMVVSKKLIFNLRDRK